MFTRFSVLTADMHIFKDQNIIFYHSRYAKILTRAVRLSFGNFCIGMRLCIFMSYVSHSVRSVMFVPDAVRYLICCGTISQNLLQSST